MEGDCEIVGRAAEHPTPPRMCCGETKGSDIICGQPDDLHYELEPMLALEEFDGCREDAETIAYSESDA